MLNENQRKWVEGLRSGKYEQQRDAVLESKGKYCCLGVALCVMDAPIRGLGGEENYLGVTELMGLTAEAKSTLWNMNDSLDKSFSEIADYIESEPEGLFRA